MPPSIDTIKSAVSDSSSYATTLVTALVSYWGTDWLHWDPATVLDEIDLTLHIHLPQSQFDRIMAGVAILTTDQFHQNLPAFVQLCSALNGDGYDPNQFDPPSAEDIAWAVSEAVLLARLFHGPSPGEDAFSAQVRGFIGSACDREGLVQPPDVLQLAIHDRPAQRSARLATWSQDPDLGQTIASAQGQKVQAINNELRGRLRLLLTQLGQLFEMPVAAVIKLIGATR